MIRPPVRRGKCGKISPVAASLEEIKQMQMREKENGRDIRKNIFSYKNTRKGREGGGGKDTTSRIQEKQRIRKEKRRKNTQFEETNIA